MDTISPVYARLVLRHLERQGIDPGPLFAGTSLTRQELLCGGDITIENFLHVLTTGQQLSHDEQLGFMLGRNVHIAALGTIGTGMMVAPTLREGARILESFTRLHASYIDIQAHSTLEGLTLSIHYRYNMGEMERFHTETSMMLIQQYTETMTGLPLSDARFRLAIPEPDNRDDYSLALHSEVSFGAAVSELDIPRHWLDIPSPYYHAQLWSEAQMSLSHRLKELGEREGAHYTQHIAALLRTSEPPLPDLASVAGELHVSERTLNRRLQAEDSSFRALKSHALADWAKRYLKDSSHSVEAIAAILGYQDTANFRRAFRKSAGCTPIEYRQSNH
jgi:AraC-like DNA-binding protein